MRFIPKNHYLCEKKKMDYYFSKILALPFGDAIERATEELKKEGFGVISDIDIQAKLHEKLGVEYKKYRILGACNPGFAYQALQAEEKIGTMLPCNVIVIEKAEGLTEVSAVNPLASMMAIRNDALEPLARAVTEKMKEIIGRL